MVCCVSMENRKAEMMERILDEVLKPLMHCLLVEGTMQVEECLLVRNRAGNTLE